MQEMQFMLNDLEQESEKAGLLIKYDKTKIITNHKVLVLNLCSKDAFEAPYSVESTFHCQ